MLIFLALALFLALFIQVFLKFLWPDYEGSKLTLEQKNQELAEDQQLVQKLRYLQKQRDQLMAELNTIINSYQVNLNGGYPLIHLDTGDLELQLDNIAPYPVYRSTYYSKLQIDMEISGSYLSILSYLERLEKLPAVIEIISPTITVKEGKLVSCRMTLNIYSLEKSLEKNEELPTGLGKYDIFTPLVQAIIPADFGEQTEDNGNSWPEIDLEENYSTFSQSETAEPGKREEEAEIKEEGKPESEIYYHFPSR